MSSFTGKKIANTYKDLLKIDTSVDNAGIDSNLRRIQDGNGKNSALSLSQNEAKIHGSLGITGTVSATSIQLDGLNVSAISATDINAANKLTINNATVATETALATVSATLETRIAAVSSTMATSIANVSSALETRIAAVSSEVSAVRELVTATNASAIAANTSAIIALSATMATSISNHLPLSGGTLTGDLSLGLNTLTVPYMDVKASGTQTVFDGSGATGVRMVADATFEIKGANRLKTMFTGGELGSTTLYYNPTTVTDPAVPRIRTQIGGTTLYSDVSITGDAYVSGNVFASAGTFTGNVTAASFYGDGSNLTNIAAASAGTSATLETRINAVSVLAETKASGATSANLETRINAVSVLAETKASASTSANLETRINAVSVLTETKASASTSANLETRINSVSALTSVNLAAIASVNTIAIAAASAGTSASLETRVNAVSALTSVNLAAITSINAVALRKDTALSATSGTFTGNVTATAFYGDGSNLTGLSGSGTMTNITAGSNISLTEAGTTVTETTTSATIAVTSSPTFDSLTVTGDLTVDTSTLYVDSTNNRVGIGTSSPTAPLMVNGGGTNFGIVVNSTDQYAGIAFADNTTTTNAHVAVYADGNELGFEAGNAERMRIDSSGNVGIGESSPDNALHITGAATSGARIKLEQTTAAKNSQVQQGSTGMSIAANGSSNPMLFETNGAERMRIDSSGNVGIGTTSTGGYKFDVAGTARANSLTFRVDGSTPSGDASIFRPTSNTVALATNSTERMRIDGSGRLLVGSTVNNGANSGTIVAGDAAATAGGVALQVRYTADDSIVNYGSQYSSGDALIGHGVASSQTAQNTFISTADNAAFARGALTVGDELKFYNASSQTTTKGSTVSMTERMRITAGGNVGLGETSPTKKLVLNENDSECVMIIKSSDTGSAGIYLGDQSDEIRGGLIFDNSTDNLYIRAADNQTAMTITSAERVAIGTTSTGSRFHVHTAADAESYMQITNSTTGTGSGDGLTIGLNSAEQAIFWQRENNDIRFGTNNTTRMTIDSSGNVGIGTNSPSAPFQIHATGSGASYMRISNDTTGSGSLNGLEIAVDSSERPYFWNYENTDMYFGTNNSERMRINSSGRVGIGESNPDGLLHLTGDTNSNGAELYLQVNNNNTADNLGAIHFGNNVDSTLSRIIGTTSGANNTSYLTFSTSNAGSQADRWTINETGRLIQNNNNEDINMSSGAAGQLKLDGSGYSAAFALNASGLQIYTNSASRDIIFGVNESERMRITDGNVGIGVTDPVERLEVNGLIAGGFGAQTTAGTTNWNDITNARSGNGYTLLRGNATNGPGGTTYFHAFSFEYGQKDGNGNMTQWAIAYSSSTLRYQRYRYGGSWSSWSAF